MLDTFFMELFNYCFPSDYRMKLREKLEHTYQNEKTAIHYAHEIQGLFNMIGNIRQGDKVLKLWRGLRMEIQQGLWRDKLNLDYNTWDEVLTVQVEHIEMSLKTGLDSILPRKRKEIHTTVLQRECTTSSKFWIRIRTIQF